MSVSGRTDGSEAPANSPRRAFLTTAGCGQKGIPGRSWPNRGFVHTHGNRSRDGEHRQNGSTPRRGRKSPPGNRRRKEDPRQNGSRKGSQVDHFRKTAAGTGSRRNGNPAVRNVEARDRNRRSGASRGTEVTAPDGKTEEDYKLPSPSPSNYQRERVPANGTPLPKPTEASGGTLQLQVRGGRPGSATLGEWIGHACKQTTTTKPTTKKNPSP